MGFDAWAKQAGAPSKNEVAQMVAAEEQVRIVPPNDPPSHAPM
jgi:hypothetical protein